MKRATLFALVAMSVMMISCVNVRLADQKETQVKQVNEVTTLEMFDKIDVCGEMQVTYSPGDAYSVLVEAPADAFEQLVIYVDRGHLCIDTKKQLKNMVLSKTSEVKVQVNSPVLKDVEMTGSGSFTTHEFNSDENLAVKMTGSGHITFSSLTCNKIDADLTGSGNITIAKLQAKEIESDVTGSGNITYEYAQAESALSKVTGSGKVMLSGAVRKHEERVTGSGKVDTSGLQ